MNKKILIVSANYYNDISDFNSNKNTILKVRWNFEHFEYVQNLKFENLLSD